MRTAQDYELEGRYAASTDGPSGLGWVTFAAVLLGLGGVWNTIAGILAITDSRVYTASSVYVFSNLNTWGWIVLIPRDHPADRGRLAACRKRVRPLVRRRSGGTERDRSVDVRAGLSVVGDCDVHGGRSDHLRAGRVRRHAYAHCLRGVFDCGSGTGLKWRARRARRGEGIAVTASANHL
jgi:hypothetical protein